MKVIGATPTSSTATEVYTGVQQGTMDAASFPFTYSHVAYKIHEVTDWFTSNLSPGTSDCPVVFSINAYNKLPAQYKKLLADVKEERHQGADPGLYRHRQEEPADAEGQAEGSEVFRGRARQVPRRRRQAGDRRVDRRKTRASSTRRA